MQNESRHNSAFKAGSAGNRSLFLSLAHQGCTPAIALWEEISVLSSDSYITKGLVQASAAFPGAAAQPFLAGR